MNLVPIAGSCIFGFSAFLIWAYRRTAGRASCKLGLYFLENHKMDITLKGAQAQIVGIADASGNPAPAGTPGFTFAVVDSTLGNVISTSPDGLQAQIGTTGKAGTTQITATNASGILTAVLTVQFDITGLQIVAVGNATALPTPAPAPVEPTPTPAPAAA